MHVGIVHHMAYPKLMSGRGPLLETLGELCEDDYFQAVEVTWYYDEEVRKEAVALAQLTGKRVIFNAQPLIIRRGLDLHHDDPHERTRALDWMKKALAQATEWKAEAFLVMSGSDPGEAKRSSAREQFVGALKELCEASRVQGGPPILLENYDRWPQGRNCLIGPTSEARSVVHQVISYFRRFGLALDLGHLPLLDEDPASAVQVAGPYLRYVHLGNCVKSDPEHPAFGDEHPSFATAGGANTLDDLALFLRALLEAGYLHRNGRNIVAFEIKPHGEETPRDVQEDAKRALDAAWKRL